MMILSLTEMLLVLSSIQVSAVKSNRVGERSGIEGRPEIIPTSIALGQLLAVPYQAGPRESLAPAFCRRFSLLAD